MIAHVGPSPLRSVCWSIAWLVCLVQGCSSGGSAWDRVAVSGTVNYAGRPVPDGSITLRPASASGGPTAGATIRDGRFEISENLGPTTGEYQAKLVIVVPDQPASRPPRPPMKRFPTVREFEQGVEIAAGDNSLSFDLGE